VLHQQALSEREIARRLGMSRHTVHRFVIAETFPERNRSTYRGSLLDPYKPYILKRWQEGCWNGTQLFDEIKERGYRGSDPYLRCFIADLRKKHQAVGNAAVLTLDDAEMAINVPADLPPKPHFTRRMSPTRVSWLYVCQQAKLEEKQLQQVEHIRKGHSGLDTAYQLSQTFVSMLAERRDMDLAGWSKPNTVAFLNSRVLRRGFDVIMRLCVLPSLLLGVTAKWRLRSTA
jgi:hypothetical protein